MTRISLFVLAAVVSFTFQPTRYTAKAMPLIHPAPIVADGLTPVHYRSYRHSHRKRSVKRSTRRSGGVPQAHIDYCNRQNMGYRVWDNTIAIDRWTRRQCSSPYYRP